MGIKSYFRSRVLKKLQEEIHRNNVQKGFYDNDFPVPRAIALMHSELSEALEAHREGNIEGKDGVGEELADTVIRILDYAEHLDIDLAEELLNKHNKNKQRDYKHGKNY